MDMVLVIEHDANFARSLEIALERQGYGVVVATDEHAAVGAADSRLFDLMILDTEMSENGEAFLTWTSQQAGCPPIILLSDKEEDEARVGGGAIVGFVRKTEGLGRLLDRVADVFPRRRPGEDRTVISQ